MKSKYMLREGIELGEHVTVDNNGVTFYTKNGILHRDDGPAVIDANGFNLWYTNGILIKTENTFTLNKLKELLSPIRPIFLEIIEQNGTNISLILVSNVLETLSFEHCDAIVKGLIGKELHGFNLTFHYVSQDEFEGEKFWDLD